MCEVYFMSLLFYSHRFPQLASPDRSVGTPCTPSQEISQPGLRRSWELYWPAENKHALRDLNFILKSTKKHEEMSAPKSWAPGAAMRRSKIQPFKDFWWKRLYKLFWILTVNCLHDPESLLDLQFVEGFVCSPSAGQTQGITKTSRPLVDVLRFHSLFNSRKSSFQLYIL